MYIEILLSRPRLRERAPRVIGNLIDKWATHHDINYKIESTDSGARLYLEEESDYVLFALDGPKFFFSRWAIVP